MSHFYGIVNGAGKTEATRRGHKTTGIETIAASYAGAIQVEVRHSIMYGADQYRIVEMSWPSKSIRRVIVDWKEFDAD